MTPEAIQTPNPPTPSCATGAPPAPQCPHAAALAATPIRDLVATARTYYAAINSRHSGISDDDMAALASFDDVLSLILARRPAGTAEEAALKAEYLTQRARAGGMSAEAEAAALASIPADFAAVAAAVPPQEPAGAAAAEAEPARAAEGPFDRLGGIDLVTALEGPISTLGTRVGFLREFFEDASAHMEHDALYLFLSDCEADARDLQRAWDALWIAAGGNAGAGDPQAVAA